MSSNVRFQLGVALLLGAFPLAAQKYQITRFYVPPPPRNVPGTAPAGINLAGQVVGTVGFHMGGFQYIQGFIRFPDGTQQYPIIDPNDAQMRDTRLTGVNDSGLISGYYSNSQQEHGFLLSNGNFTDISEMQGGLTRVFSLNNNGDFCGAFGDQDPPQHGFISISGNLTQVDVPGFALTWVTGLGLSGAAVGNGNPVGAGGAVSFVRGPTGTLSTFQVKNSDPAFGTFATGIDTQAQLIVGYYYDTTDRVHGFVVHYVRTLDEPAALAAAGESAFMGAAKIDAVVIDAGSKGDTFITGVNSNGVITGYWQDWQDSVPGTFGFIGTPIQ